MRSSRISLSLFNEKTKTPFTVYMDFPPCSTVFHNLMSRFNVHRLPKDSKQKEVCERLAVQTEKTLPARMFQNE